MSTVVSCQRPILLFVRVSLVYVVPGVVVFAVYAKIFVVVRRHRRAVGPSPSAVRVQSSSPPRPGGAARYNIYGFSAKAAKKLFIIYVAYWLMYGPKTNSF